MSVDNIIDDMARDLRRALLDLGLNPAKSPSSPMPVNAAWDEYQPRGGLHFTQPEPFAQALRGAVMSTRQEVGDCFSVAADIVMEYQGPGGEDLVLVHGTVIGQGKIAGIPHEHAWVEVPSCGLVLDQSNGLNVCVSRVRYYEIGQITNVRRYSKHEAEQMMLDNGHYGPWEEQ